MFRHHLEVNTSVVDEELCKEKTPTAEEFFKDVPWWSCVLLVVLCLCALLSLIIYVDEIVFIVRQFKSDASQTMRLVWILAFFPVYTLTSLLAILIPRCATLADLVANTFFATCFYQFIGLMENYLGGHQHILASLDRQPQEGLVSMATPPLCCCCLCLPHVSLTRKTYSAFRAMVVQFAVFRPLLMFTAAVLWTNGSYEPTNFSPCSGYLYVSLLNLVTTGVAMWGLMILRSTFHSRLDRRFHLTMKIACVQLSLITSTVTEILLSILTEAGVITCTPYLNARDRTEAIYHSILTILMTLFGILGHYAYRQVPVAAADRDDVFGPLDHDEEHIGSSICIQPASPDSTTVTLDTPLDETPSKAKIFDIAHHSHLDPLSQQPPTTNDVLTYV